MPKKNQNEQINTEEQIQAEQVQAEEVREEEIRTEEYVFNGDELVAKIKELFHEGNVRRLTIYSESGTVLLDVPLTMGLVGVTAAVVLAPIFSTIAVLAAILVRLKVKIERVEKKVDETE